MTSSPRINAVAWCMAVALGGCHTLPFLTSADLGSGRGRVDRSFPAGLRTTTLATITALSGLGVRPTALSFTSVTGDPAQQSAVVVTPLPETTAELLDGKLFKEILFNQKMIGPADQSIPFHPVMMTFKGQGHDGRHLVVIVQSRRFEAADDKETLVTVRVGPLGDHAWSQDLLDKVAARIEGPQASAAVPVVKPTPPR